MSPPPAGCCWRRPSGVIKRVGGGLGWGFQRSQTSRLYLRLVDRNVVFFLKSVLAWNGKVWRKLLNLLILLSPFHHPLPSPQPHVSEFPTVQEELRGAAYQRSIDPGRHRVEDGPPDWNAVSILPKNPSFIRSPTLISIPCSSSSPLLPSPALDSCLLAPCLSLVGTPSLASSPVHMSTKGPASLKRQPALLSS